MKRVIKIATVFLCLSLNMISAMEQKDAKNTIEIAEKHNIEGNESLRLFLDMCEKNNGVPTCYCQLIAAIESFVTAAEIYHKVYSITQNGEELKNAVENYVAATNCSELIPNLDIKLSTRLNMVAGNIKLSTRIEIIKKKAGIS
jgi:hypothetical protein